MAAPSVRTLDQILAEIGTVYNPQIQSVQTRLNDIPNQIKAEEQGLSAQKDQAFGNILDGARRRGLGFSGIPLGEQAKYTATDYLPALARLRQSGKEQAMSLQDAINQIQERRQNQALSLQQYDQQRYDAYESEQRQLAAQREAAARQAAATRAAAPTYNTGGGAAQAAQPAAQMVEQAPGSFSFINASGSPITAGQYAKETGNDIRDVLYSMAQRGDAGAAAAYNDIRYGRISQSTIDKYSHILGGITPNYTPTGGLTVSSLGDLPGLKTKTNTLLGIPGLGAR